MLVSRLVPMLVFGGVAVHSGGAIKDRLAAFTGVSNKIVTKQHMTAIIEAARLQIASGDDVNLEGDGFRDWVRRSVRVSGNKRGDLSLDQWGTPYKVTQRSAILTLISAGPDKRFGTADDIKVEDDIGEF